MPAKLELTHTAPWPDSLQKVLVELTTRSALPLMTLILLSATLLWGPWPTLILGWVAWDLASRVA